MNNTKRTLILLYWLIVFTAQIFIIWFCFVLMFQDSSWPASSWQRIAAGWPLVIISLVAVSLIAYAGTQLIRLLTALFFETRKKK